ncbi:MAG: NAD(P)-dependent oxidoreductase [Candidatus Andeanibacterium colombiense]|uniref:NAD(P)-dependent oxidoreductase n=1 Tax=Candidatus Andeanibacterium colombiense TaxID=3121345 RepID=A0AAJ5X2A6_9SPHN|nr:MAG: NAD(P)-dependent oxidoreductase [Sphingomonadaceae bacterium]
MAANVAKAGHELMAYDADAARLAQFVEETGARAAESLEQLGSCEIVIAMLPTGPVVREVLLSAEQGGFTRNPHPELMVIDMSSSEPVGTRELGEQLARHGIRLVDAPVSGGMTRAADGTLAIMLGVDDEADAARVEPILLTMSTRIFRTGPLGSGHAMKALNNYVSAACFAATAEALVIGEQFGLDPSVIVDIMNVSTGKNFQTEVVMKSHVVERQFATGFKIGLLTKDIRIAADLAREMQIETPVLELIYSRWQTATEQLGADRDNSEAVLSWNRGREALSA